MNHIDCKNYVHLDCEKGMCALSKVILPIDGEGSNACSKFVPAERCACCACFKDHDKYGIGTCTGFEKENWAYSSCGATGCEHFQMK